MKYFFTLILFLSLSNLQSQNLGSTGARAQSLGNSTGASINFWNITNNPSATAFIDNTSIGIDAKNNFMIKELTTATLALLLPTNNYGNFGFTLQRFGYSTFNENKLAISYSKRLSNSTSASVQLSDNIQNIRGEEFKSTEHEIGFNLGLFTKLNDNIHLASYYNFQKNITDTEIKNIQEFSLALSWFPISDLNVLMEINKRTNTNISLRGGIEYKILKRISARVGISSEPLNVAIGLGIMFDDLYIDIGFAHHQYLGMTSGISGNYIFRNK
jgi:hypothetical protein